ncbi:MAG: hypothetical protein Q8Q14_12645 [Gemmatimonadales bacterium]|nr:hypothetical protein [Gemmatimonadales bacterium]
MAMSLKIEWQATGNPDTNRNGVIEVPFDGDPHCSNEQLEAKILVALWPAVDLMRPDGAFHGGAWVRHPHSGYLRHIKFWALAPRPNWRSECLDPAEALTRRPDAAYAAGANAIFQASADARTIKQLRHELAAANQEIADLGKTADLHRRERARCEQLIAQGVKAEQRAKQIEQALAADLAKAKLAKGEAWPCPYCMQPATRFAPAEYAIGACEDHATLLEAKGVELLPIPADRPKDHMGRPDLWPDQVASVSRLERMCGVIGARRGSRPPAADFGVRAPGLLERYGIVT